jgi:hypothetical protein
MTLQEKLEERFPGRLKNEKRLLLMVCQYGITTAITDLAKGIFEKDLRGPEVREIRSMMEKILTTGTCLLFLFGIVLPVVGL